MNQVVVTDWQNWCRNLSGVNVCFQRGSNEADCSIWLFCRVQKWNDICQGCLPSGRMCRSVEHIYGIWLDSRCIGVHRLVNELWNLLVCAVQF